MVGTEHGEGMDSSTSGLRYFPPSNRHAYLDAESVKRLVRNVKAGLDHPANLEKTANSWRLRVKFTLDNGQTIRRSVTLPDSDTALWVARYLEKSRIAVQKRKSRIDKTYYDTSRRQHD